MLPELFSLGPVTVYSFGVMMALGFVCSYLLIRARFGELGHTREWAVDLILAGAVGGLIGSRVWWLVENRSEVDDLLGEAFSGTGLTWYGGLLGGAITVLAVMRLHRVPIADTLDACGAALAAGQAMGRIGCELAGDGDYGRETDAPFPFAHAYPEGTVPTTERVWATPPMEAAALLLITYVLWRLRGRLAPGRAFALAMVLIGIERLLIELIRRNDEVLGPFTTPQVVSLVLIAGGAAFLAVSRGRPPREVDVSR